jgi:DNA repair exonuclease SbcCD nuclease subunit
MSIKSPLKWAICGDIHLGHPNTPTDHIIQNLKAMFPDTPETGELDIIVLEGDVFDRLLQWPTDAVNSIEVWVYHFLAMCLKRDILVMVLEGTPSHDWHQSNVFIRVARLAGLSPWPDQPVEPGRDYVQLFYIDRLAIQYFKRFDINVLFVPDEWRPETDDTWREVKALLAEKGLEQVDYAVMHGAFNYQIPAHFRAPSHDEQRYMSVVKKYIFIGHIHQMSTYGGKILAAGSADRLSHGDESAKGHFRVTVSEDGDQIVFVENKHAKLYNTINVSGLNLDEALAELEQVDKYPAGSAVRIEADKDAAILSSLETLRKRYPHVTWSTKTQMAESPQSNLLVDLRSSYVEVPITSANIVELIQARLIKRGLPQEIIDRCLRQLQKVA